VAGSSDPWLAAVGRQWPRQGAAPGAFAGFMRHARMLGPLGKHGGRGLGGSDWSRVYWVHDQPGMTSTAGKYRNRCEPGRTGAQVLGW
jgi:hypothetical protein